MVDKIIKYASYAAFIILGIYVLVTFLKVKLAKGEETDAEVLEVDENFNGDTYSCYVTVKYFTRDGEQVDAVIMNSDSSLKAGQIIRIKYLLNDKLHPLMIERKD